MTIQINSNYLEKYAHEYAAITCDKVFSSRQFITGQDIIQLTDSIQVNFFVLKRIFENWQGELEKLKSSPYFDYRDVAVHEALTQFMNVLSKRIKVEKSNLEPIVAQAVSEAIQLAVDPVSFYQNQIQKAPHGMINEYLSEHKRYFKWHLPVISFLIDKTGFGHDQSAYIKAVATNYQVIKDTLVSKNLLLATLGEIKAFDLDNFLIAEELEVPKAAPIRIEEEPKEAETRSFFDDVDHNTGKIAEPAPEVIKVSIQEKESERRATGILDVRNLKSRFEKESYKGMKGVIGELSESLAINQRIMFSKALFEGNSDLLMHALKLIDESGSFDNAIELINIRYVDQLSWTDNPEVMDEFLLLVFRKFSS